MKKLVFSEKENRYVELEFTLDSNNQKVYNESVQRYDQDGNAIKILTKEDREREFIANVENDVLNASYARDRLDICKSCEYHSFKFCKKCSCFLPFKVLIKGTDCPIKKWNSIND